MKFLYIESKRTMKDNMLQQHLIKEILPSIKLTETEIQLVKLYSKDFITKIRSDRSHSIEKLVHKFSLSNAEGVSVMALAESLLRTRDNYTSKNLIIDKLKNKEWLSKLISSQPSFKTFIMSLGLVLCNVYTQIINNKNFISTSIDQACTPLVIKLMKLAIYELSREFILASDIRSAIEKSSKMDNFHFAFDLLGESSRTLPQAQTYFDNYLEAIDIIAKAQDAQHTINKANNSKSEQKVKSNSGKLFDNHNLSVKLTALDPHFQWKNFEILKQRLLPKLITLTEKAMENNLTITFDAEESSRLDCYMQILKLLIEDKKFSKYNGIGLVLQAYQVRSKSVLEEIIAIAKKTNKIIPLRLVKGAYWDSEIKNAQKLGLESYPVFTKKEYTDANYISLAKTMLSNDKYIYSQFATHNALSVAYIKLLGSGKNYEIQKLHGMGNSLAKQIVQENKVRIYAPVGSSTDLLAYLLRRMLENGSSSSFVNKVVNKKIRYAELAYDLHDRVINLIDTKDPIVLPKYLYPKRENAMGYDLGVKANYDYINEKVLSCFESNYNAASIIGGRDYFIPKHAIDQFSPARNAERVSSYSMVQDKAIKEALSLAENEYESWNQKKVEDRANILNKIATLLDKNKFKLYALLIQEGGKTIKDAIDEVIEAIDFCRYYAIKAQELMQEIKLPGPTGELNTLSHSGKGIIACISPWNFPLAIFTGQIAAALVTGNCVLAKPASQTSAIAHFVITLMHKAGISTNALHLILTTGQSMSDYALSDGRISGVLFTGSDKSAKAINQTLAARDTYIATLVAETGGQNAMLVDSSSLLEQVCDDVIESAFFSAGQRCSACRMLYVQEEIYDDLITMLKDAVDILKIGDPADFASDIGPVIDQTSYKSLKSHIKNMEEKGFTIHKHPLNDSIKTGNFFYPHIIEVNSINDIEQEQFGPILHIAKFSAKKIDNVIDDINNYGYGLTFGMHSRIDERIQYVKSRIKVGNFYANKTMTGAKVESQPFGGERASGTGYKAGGPNYLLKLISERAVSVNLTAIGGDVELLK